MFFSTSINLCFYFKKSQNKKKSELQQNSFFQAFKSVIFIITIIVILFSFDNILAQGTWTPQTSGNSDWFEDICFLNDNTGWVVGRIDSILTTTNGGQTWFNQGLGTANKTLGVYFTDTNTGWVVGKAGEIVHTNDGGNNWAPQVSGVSKDIYAVFFTDSNTGWAVTKSGSIIHTSDGGNNWTSQVSGTTKDLYSVFFTDSNTGWAAGKLGELLHTSDGGNNWTPQVSGTSNNLNSIHFTDSNTGWASGKGGVLLYTSDGGNNWTPQVSGTTTDLFDVHFTDSNTGWITGKGGIILHTADSGINWNTQSSGTVNDLNSVFFINSNIGWAAGFNGTILKYSLNNTPVLSPVGNYTVDEAQLLTITLSAFDADGDPLTYSAFNMPSGASFTDSTFAWTPTFSQSGSYNITFKVSDGSVEDSEVVTITVNNVNQTPANQPPVLSTIGNKEINENEQLIITLSATDLDNNSLSYGTNNKPPGAIFNGNIFTWKPGYEQSGSYNVTFVVTDGINSDFETITITVKNVNRPPVLADIENKTIYENEQVILMLSAVDEDGDSLVYSMNNTLPGSNIKDNFFAWTPNYEQSGLYEITFTVSDGDKNDSEVVIIQVIDVIQTPVISSIGDQNIDLNNLLPTALSVGNSENENLLYSLIQAPVGMTIDSLTGIINWTPTSKGTFEVVFKVRNGISEEIHSFNIEITNKPPELESIGEININENEQLTINLCAVDEDGNHLFYSVIGLPQGADFKDSIFIWTPTFGQSGSYNVIFKVWDGLKADSEAVSIFVNDVNQAPVLSIIGNKEINEAQNLLITLSSTDADGESLSYSVINNPAGSSLKDSNFSWTPTFEQSGSYEITFIVTDGLESDSVNVVITVNGVNQAPVLSNIGNKEINEAQNLLITLSSTDADGESLSYSVINNPPGSSLKDCNFSWTPTFEQSGSYEITFIVSDGFESDSVNVLITVNGVNQAPVLSTIGNKEINEAQNLLIALSSTDADGDSLSYSVINNPPGSSLINSNFTWTPTFEQSGLYEITFIVTDGFAGDSVNVLITVNGVNQPPVLSTIGNKEINETQNLLIALSSTDADGDSLSYSVINNPAGSSLINSNFTWTPTTEQSGLYEITFNVSDGINNDTETITISVNNILPDLKIESDSLFFQIVDSNLVKISVKINNSGDLYAENFIVRFYSENLFNSDQEFISKAVTCIDSIFVEHLEPDSSKTLTIYWYFPPFHTNIYCIIDPDTKIPESDLNNNHICSILCNHFIMSAYNLTANSIKIVSSDSIIFKGENVKIAGKIINTGTAAINNITVELSDVFSDGSKNLICQNTIESLAPSEEIDIEIDYNTCDKNSGLHKIILSVDPCCIFQENNKTDNIIYKEVIIYDTGSSLCNVSESLNFSEDSDYTLQLSDYFKSDIDINNIQCIITTNDSALFAFLDNSTGQIILIPSFNFNGNVELYIRMTDSNFFVDLDTIHVNIQAVNDPPVLTNIPDTCFYEDDTLAIDFSYLYKYVSDIDNNETSLRWAIDADENISYKLEENSLKLFCSPNHSGLNELALIVSDGEYSDTANFKIEVYSVNDAPGEFSIIFPCLNDTSNFSEIRWTKSSNFDPEDTIKYCLSLMNKNSQIDTIVTVNGLIDTFYIFDKIQKSGLEKGTSYYISLYAEDTHGFKTWAVNSQKMVYGTEEEKADGFVKLPALFKLNQNYPNPFNNGTTINFSLPNPETVLLKIYNIQGQEIKTLVNRFLPSGHHKVQWDGLNQNGIPAASGLYIYIIQTKTFVKSKKMTLLK
ncbi:tandem-95 repeat protein [candidate division KSB1 bacterium]